jgi:pilus assembly protein Flp/PilA
MHRSNEQTMPPDMTLQASLARHCARFGADERGATAIEYAMIASGVAVAIAATVWSLGSSIKTTLYDKISGALP